jgi:Fe-S cluster biogenesis protein NfuA
MVPVGRSVRTLGDVRDQVEEVITVIRPAIQADNGDVILHDVDEETGIVTVELIGACVSCAASSITLKAGLERIMKDRVPGVTEVVNLGEVVDPIVETAVTL